MNTASTARAAMLAAAVCSFAAGHAAAGAAEDDVSAVPGSPEQVTPIEVGAKVPQVRLTTVDGKPFDLGAAVAEQPSVLIFYRGGW